MAVIDPSGYYSASASSNALPAFFDARHPLDNPGEIEGFLDQGERWVSAAGSMDIADMSPEHALNAAYLLLANATKIALVLQVANPDYFLASELASEVQARRLIMATVLFAGLIQRAAVEVIDLPSWAR